MENVKTALSNALEIAGEKAQYDNQVKNIIANKPILAWILKFTVSEFKDASIADIIELIEGEPEVATVAVHPGQTNAPKITGLSNENTVPYEGKVTFDIRFFVYTPDRNKKIKLIVNVEAQKSFNPGYDLTTRGVYYAARSLSAQKDTEFVNDNYDDLKKVYSIWVCMGATGLVSDTITSYRMAPHVIYGVYNGEASRYDLLEVIMICLGKKARKSNSTIIKLLDTVLAHDIPVETKKNVLFDDYGIEPTEKLIKEMNTMCNLSDIVEEKGIQQGKLMARAEMVDEYIQQTDALNPCLEEICSKFNISVEDYYAVKK